MRLGFFKQGISIMSLFFVVLSLYAGMRLKILLFPLPVIWFYSFFHVQNLMGLPDEEFYKVEDRWLLGLIETSIAKLHDERKNERMAAVVLLLLGISVLWSNVSDLFLNYTSVYIGGYDSEIYQFVRNIVNRLPQLIVGIVAVVGALYLLQGKNFWKHHVKKEEKDEFSEDDDQEEQPREFLKIDIEALEKKVNPETQETLEEEKHRQEKMTDDSTVLIEPIFFVEEEKTVENIEKAQVGSEEKEAIERVRTVDLPEDESDADTGIDEVL